jgi:DNA-binding response OmpR family regulator
MRLLVVEDAPKMAQMLQRGLAEEGYQVDVCALAADAERQARAHSYDLMVLDWSLPDDDGVAMLRRLRDAGWHVPVLMLTARGTVGERVTGLRAGADDYLIKPFDFDELLARIEALLRRGGARLSSPHFQSLVLDLGRRTLKGPAGEVALTAREFTLCAEFLAHPGDVLTRSQLLTHAWGHEYDRTHNVVDVYVSYLRSKLQAVGAQDVEIQAVRGMGYRLTGKRS